ncbi:PP2C family protein-serine/threonine phosphatase [Aeoliella sp.]|uniref:PP2C family protein-serine/threonine phosphatase n=1 Tax=Aeoliella sp. TaxID=2795800 RepID=UPI003CCBD771
MPSIGKRLLLAVNIPVLVLAVLLLSYDYHRAFNRGLTSKRIALEEEAKTLLPALLRIHADRPHDTQAFIDSVCGLMHDTDSPGHHIAVVIGNRKFQAVAHGRASPEMFQAMQKTADSNDHLASRGGESLIVAEQSTPLATAYVSESLENVRQAVRADVLRRSAGFALIAGVAAVIINVVLLYVITKPIEALVETVQRIREGELGARSDSFRTRELEYLSEEINLMSQSLATAEKARQTQMAKAREIQLNLLPNGVKPDGVHFAHLFVPANDVGGDYFDVLKRADGTWLFCIADVSGHGIPAAMNAAMLKSLMSQAAQHCLAPSQVLSEVNRQFCAMSLDGDFATLLVLSIDPNSYRLDYASAGHEPGWLFREGGELKQLESTGMPLGVLGNAAWEDVRTYFEQDDRLLLVTDGVCETGDSSGQLFGRERIGQHLKRFRGAGATGVVDALNQSLTQYRGSANQTDDVTVLLIERKQSETE